MGHNETSIERNIMDNDAKNEVLVEMMGFLEDIDNLQDLAEKTQSIEFEDLTPAAWRGVQELQKALIMLCGFVKPILSQGHKIIDNDALYAHLTTVLEAED
jgi:hypothetical protein